MPFPAANGATLPLTPAEAWLAARNTAAQIKATATNLQAQISAGTLNAQALINTFANFAALNTQLTSYAAVPGIVTYAQAQMNNSNENVANDFSTMQAALVAVGTWIMNNFPSATAVTLSSNGVAWQVYTSNQTAPLATLLTTLLATIS
jgi:hypothetical protein